MGNKQSGDEEASYNNSTSGRGGEGDDFHYSNVTKVVHNATHQRRGGLGEEQKQLPSNLTNAEDRISLRWLSKQPPDIILENFKVLSIGTSVTNCKVTRNMAEGDGGGLYLGFGTSGNSIDTTFEGNKANDNGGAIFVSDAPFAIDASKGANGDEYLCNFNFNSVKSGRGGAIFVERRGSVNVGNCKFKSNGLQIGTEGGAIAALNTATIKVLASMFDDNGAAINGGAMFAMHDSKLTSNGLSL